MKDRPREGPPATSRAVRGPPNEDFGLPPDAPCEGRFKTRDGFDDEAVGREAHRGRKPVPGTNYLYFAASFSDSRARIAASRPTAVNVVPHSM